MILGLGLSAEAETFEIWLAVRLEVWLDVEWSVPRMAWLRLHP